MTLEELSNQIPDYAKDMRVNLSNVLQQAELNDQQRWGTGGVRVRWRVTTWTSSKRSSLRPPGIFLRKR